ncbi:hypothetical protein BX616_010614 [Lobosporangium transversale]|uniref:Uncharacterized protein n=1 Tax=Lobosporangium transversale TaxID=64571 RepID=A0A1Y2GU19_9FUNG|nr:hypothetical protein BCR41DRAFT_394033 [Lobosporangium transversale]KAF9911331.1 hypothetical protein BX616_010614 [Lobosporangium transversale]ORZ23718.1 hypothetical protein BCR41DRAFT_394033 [Lobosporangium transversale]|eukprot:XP_021883532.1 hypothetical protein BCR41DRAFT_394033 [Lobosporangium transversale]
MTELQYQQFRKANSDIIEEVCVRTASTNASLSYFVSLQDIRDAFPDALRFKLDGHPIPIIPYADGNRIEPLRIAFYPNKILAGCHYRAAAVQQQLATLIMRRLKRDDEVIKLQLEMLKLQLEAKEKDDKMLEMQREAIMLQHQALSRLALLQKHAEAILIQNFELHEYSIPRLFIILPVDRTKWDPMNILRNKFRLHFLCECGDHSVKANKNIGNEYILGCFSGISPKSTGCWIDYSLDYMKALSVEHSVLNNVNTLDDYEGLEGADLRQLGTFLQTNDEERQLSNLYRTTTEMGHVKWVCIDHYRATYREKDQKGFENVVEMNGGKYDLQLGKVVIKLKSRTRAGEFFSALTNARNVYELNITFDWEWTKTDLETLENALKISSVSLLRLDLGWVQEKVSKKVLSTSTRYDLLAR